MAITSEYYQPSSDGITLLHVNQWTPVSRPVRGVVQIAHGVSEYGGRYAPFARFLCANGFAVVAHDHLGHGLSVAEGQPRIYFGEKDGWAHVVDDLDALRRGETVYSPTYDYTMHNRAAETVEVRPARVILVEGILIFVEPALRERMDIMLFVDTDTDVRILRRI